MSDIENLPWPVGPNGTTNITTMEARSGLTDLVCALKHALSVSIPGSILTFTTVSDFTAACTRLFSLACVPHTDGGVIRMGTPKAIPMATILQPCRSVSISW